MVCHTPQRRGTLTKSHAIATTHVGVVEGMSARCGSVIQKPSFFAPPYDYALRLKIMTHLAGPRGAAVFSPASSAVT